MPFNDRTPESMVGRSDSKNPATTCKGITSNGRPCRRALASPKSSPLRSSGVVAFVQDSSSGTRSATYYCWQHKEQAENLARQPNHSHSTLLPVKERTSMDSLVARLGVVTLVSHEGQSRAYTYQSSVQSQRSSARPSPPQAKMHEPRDARSHEAAYPPMSDQRSKQPRQSFWSSLCCMRRPSEDDDYTEVIRHRQRLPEMSSVSAYPTHPQARPLAQCPANMQVHRTAPPPQARSAARSSTSRPSPTEPYRQPLSGLSPQRAHHVQSRGNASPLSFIPSTLAPQTMATLLSELSKPISPYDEEGYIYIFWLTDQDRTPSKDIAASLLAPSTPLHPHHLSDMMNEYSPSTPTKPYGTRTRTIKLKIGRANNVHRRMNEWTRQCGYSLSLVRWYPYVPPAGLSPSSSSSPSRTSQAHTTTPSFAAADHHHVRKVPHAHRVERLVHLELADKRIRRDCAQCGKEHREWFEVEATESGVGAVDEVVRRWVAWAEGVGPQGGASG